MKSSNPNCADDTPQATFAISSARVVTPEGERPAAIVVERETIRAVIPMDELPKGIPVQDYGSLVISPGIVDAHVHINEPGRTEWEGFVSATSAAAAGGITTLIEMPLNSSPVTTSAAALKLKRKSAQGKCHVDVGFYGGLAPGNHPHDSTSAGPNEMDDAGNLRDLVKAGVFGIKAFMCDSGLEEFPASTESDLRIALKILQGTGIPLLAHAEWVDETLAPNIRDPRSYQQYQASRPPEFELAAIRLLVELCREFQTPIHIVHLATAQALELLQSAKDEGLPLTVETCPHYLYFSNEEIDDGQTAFKCAPPIRSKKNRDRLRDAVQSGLIETIGSDHSPCLPELKLIESGDFPNAWGGISGLQLTLPVTWTIGNPLGWTPWMLAERLSHRPAEVFSVPNKGRIESGFDADFVIWDPDQEFTVRGKELFHRHSVTPYEGQTLAGVVKHTLLRGRQVFGNRKVNAAFGRCLTRGSDNPRKFAAYLNRLSLSQRASKFESCCAAQAWVDQMTEPGFQSDFEVEARARSAWDGLQEKDFLEAFNAHPRIGDVDTLRERYANTKLIASQEQAGVNFADESVLERLVAANDEYFEKFGFIFIVCATGKSAAEMLEILERRLPNERTMEIENAATEQLKITLIRLNKLKQEI